MAFMDFDPTDPEQVSAALHRQEEWAKKTLAGEIPLSIKDETAHELMAEVVMGSLADHIAQLCPGTTEVNSLIISTFVLQHLDVLGVLKTFEDWDRIFESLRRARGIINEVNSALEGVE